MAQVGVTKPEGPKVKERSHERPGHSSVFPVSVGQAEPYSAATHLLLRLSGETCEGYGSGSAYGEGFGDGTGYGDTYADGYGPGDGSGYGDGDGTGSGWGPGRGSGDGTGKG